MPSLNQHLKYPVPHRGSGREDPSRHGARLYKGKIVNRHRSRGFTNTPKEEKTMTQEKQREYLINRLLKEQPEYRMLRILSDTDGQRKLLRSLMNVRMPGDLDREFLRIQDEYLQ